MSSETEYAQDWTPVRPGEKTTMYEMISVGKRPWINRIACKGMTDTMCPTKWVPEPGTDIYDADWVKNKNNYPISNVEGIIKAKTICDTCPVRIDCLAKAIEITEDDAPFIHVILGGTTGAERRAICRQHLRQQADGKPANYTEDNAWSNTANMAWLLADYGCDFQQNVWVNPPIIPTPALIPDPDLITEPAPIPMPDLIVVPEIVVQDVTGTFTQPGFDWSVVA
jgi:hypothetical protein